MTSPFLGEIQVFGFNFAPYQWAVASGQTVSLSQFTALYALIGTTYGGNGQTGFQLPNLIGRQPCNQGQGPGRTQRVIGEPFGEFNVTLLVSEMPSHSHTLTPSGAGSGATTSSQPKAGSGVGKFNPDLYVTGNPTPNATLAPTAVSPNGGSTPHNNQQPFLAVNMCIALAGAFPQFN